MSNKSLDIEEKRDEETRKWVLSGILVSPSVYAIEDDDVFPQESCMS